MSFRATIERIDADYFIPRPADEPELDSLQAARRFMQDDNIEVMLPIKKFRRPVKWTIIPCED